MSRRRTVCAVACAAWLASCAAPPSWQRDVSLAVSQAQARGQDLVVYFALPGQDRSDAMEAQLADEVVLAALAAGGYSAVVANAIDRKRLYEAWVGGADGMGMCVLDENSYCYAARPGPQDPGQVAAFLDLCAEKRAEVRRLRARLQGADAGIMDEFELGRLLLQLGCRVNAGELLRNAAVTGVAEARYHLAHLYALDGNVTAARQWLRAAPKTPGARWVEGYVLFKEHRYVEAVQVIQEAVATNKLGSERQNALLYLGKSLHQAKRDREAIPILEALVAEGTGSTYEAAATHTLGHIYNPDHGH